MDVEYCLNNVSPDVSDEIASSFTGARPRGCLQRCGLCERGPFLVVDGQFHAGESHVSLLAAFRRREDGPGTGRNGDG